ncbi:5-formyltetrahydrofolate cyclo-ligase [Candidatus Woesearchaeota archaeon]|nr:5-formyltetrahydrofolate cyclo-ligase [Candidatus Woesearchaeota archaeon]
MKQKLRKEILEKRDSLPKEDINKKSNIIKEKLFSLGEYKLAKTICFFVSFDSEVKTHSMIKEAVKEGKSVCVPIATDHTLTLSKIKDFNDLNKKNKYGILEPSKLNKIKKQEVDLIIVPGTVFDKECHRIGYGKGYYDGLLKGYKGLSIGICFDLQMVDKVPRNEWDEKIDIVITEERIIE